MKGLEAGGDVGKELTSVKQLHLTKQAFFQKAICIIIYKADSF